MSGATEVFVSWKMFDMRVEAGGRSALEPCAILSRPNMPERQQTVNPGRLKAEATPRAFALSVFQSCIDLFQRFNRN